ncbi:hypothetical protein BT63DRAFT_436458 [Microthyrium microscopicum]|uniref:WW domain-containing protein n=1 Tax=Microthyrium microscopicum TaxID=703497 RepID=A0A6A6UK16_9PEZI|nr:hypothetical protein BT63DRAFT_436458 [Microthyrium microscopicum]
MTSPSPQKSTSEATSSNAPTPENESHREASEDGEHTPSPEHDVESEQPPLPDEEAPPLPDEDAPPLPDEAPPLPDEAPPDNDDGWEPVWDATAQAFYFFNRFTKATQWDNPRVPIEPSAIPSVAGLGSHDRIGSIPKPKKSVAGGYNPAIHGDYDPNADYAQAAVDSDEEQKPAVAAAAVVDDYTATGTFNRFTGKWQASTLNPENYNDENKSKRQMNAFFDVDAAANTHDGRSLKAERQNKKFSKKEIKAFKDKRRERKEEKRRAWLMD